ncbi:MAG: hypothetical protein DCF19_07775 [Pseudanabaena frigida]|uniref:Uncharacterized protein n=1 Tax=Pseudanabaena frigida TaxID=945775 RepID=A0A2W4WAS0_9CYAN|nr:MAG: hypothetical protein DCF19_07775 [Pseudanabaena frigida]
MKSIKKKYCYIATYKLPANSIWQKYPIQDVFPNNEGLVSIFENDRYKLLAEIELDGKINSVIYELDTEEKFHNDNFHEFKTESLEVIINSLNRMQIAFIGLQNQNWYYTAETKNNWTISTSILDYETGTKSLILGFDLRQDLIMNCYLSQDPPITLQSIFKVLEVDNDNIDKYIGRFLSLKSLSTDPLLHLISLFSLHEYINEYDEFFKLLFNTEIAGKSIVVNGSIVKLKFFDKFKCARDFVAHSFLHGAKTLDTLKQFLKSDSSGNLLLFNRYNQDHINLINEVIGEAQTIIQRYLREQLGVHKLP